MRSYGEPVRVECLAGGRADEEPRRVRPDGAPLDVLRVLERGRTPDEQRFLVELEDGRRCRLTQTLRDGRWWMRPA